MDVEQSPGVAAPAQPAVPGSPANWRRTAESILIPVGAVLVVLMLFGIFCACYVANPFLVFASIYRAAFGSWYSFQNTLIRAAPLMLAALCTAMPARLGLIIIGNEGALVVGGVGAVAVGLAVATAPPFIVLAIYEKRVRFVDPQTPADA